MHYELNLIFENKFAMKIFMKIFYNYTIEIFAMISIICIFNSDIYIITLLNEFAIKYNPLKILKEFICRKKHEARPSIQFLQDNEIHVESNNISVSMREKKVDQYAILVSHLYKTYVNFPAVRNVSFGIKRGQCFGLMGVNGAGKTSIFKMISLNVPITSGTIYLNGLHHHENLSLYRKQFGYCPEQHALLDFMNIREIFKHMAWIQGTPYSNLNSIANHWIKSIGLEGSEQKLLVELSGGTKRKLNTALSMICNPSIILLDEPTSGVDPISKLLIWNCIKEFQNNNHTIFMSSHSVNELDELCDRIAVLNSGKLQCIGYLHEIKRLYGNRFTLLIKLKETTSFQMTQMIITEIQKLYYCELRDSYSVSIIFN